MKIKLYLRDSHSEEIKEIENKTIPEVVLLKGDISTTAYSLVSSGVDEKNKFYGLYNRVNSFIIEDKPLLPLKVMVRKKKK